MSNLRLIQQLAIQNDLKIVLLVADGLGGISTLERASELETARRPNLDRAAAEGITGLMDPVSPGITPGSGPGHLALFGYDPLEFEIGRGILSALGVNFEIQAADVAARVNFATIDSAGVITDRRAGRISTERCVQLCEELSRIQLSGVQIFVRPEKEHRAAVILRGKELSGSLTDSDPQKTGEKPLEVKPRDPQDPAAVKTARIVNEFIALAFQSLAKHHPANAILMRGFDRYERLPSFQEIYKLNPACIAVYPMYKGVARLVGMKVYEEGQESVAEQFELLRRCWADHDFFFVHIKKTDSYGEDGNFEAKVKMIEEIDHQLPQILSLHPDVLIVTADHCTPVDFKAHSFHPVPVLLRSRYARVDDVRAFTEKDCLQGGLGRFPSKELMPLALAHALKLNKYGA